MKKIYKEEVIIEKELISARRLKKILENKSNFSVWIKRHIEINKLNEKYDYFIEKTEVHMMKSIHKEKNDYLLTKQACRKIILSQSRNKNAEKIISKLERGLELTKIITEIDKEKNQEVKIIRIEDEEYPKQLRIIKNPPKQIYVKGNIENLREYGIAVIGSRDCSNYGRRICKIFTNNLVGYNLNIISGLAVGIDCCAHKACIKAKGKTIAVLPSGFNNIYPEENEGLLNEILESGGTVLTEYPPEFEKTQESCRERNRIMSGLAIATLVVEAEERSGTSITVRNANEQNKKAFCIPSSLLNSKGIGTNGMIKENKAKLITKVEDIIKEFPELKLEEKVNFNFLETKRKERIKKEKTVKVNIKIEEENLDLYNFLTREPKGIDEIAEVLNRPIKEITYKLTLLELKGAIEELPGKKFKIK